ncbi:hypothetical protein J3D55_001701 [Chryseobacterium ginsenosidimutans]|nr:hypothetical protein [Chryseobacterium ginsenosidimutans]
MKDFDNEFGDFSQFKTMTFEEVNKRFEEEIKKLLK